MIQVYKNIYLKELPLPNNPLKALNLYIIKGKNKSMIIDTGFNRDDTKDEIIQVFDELDIRFEDTILYLTHYHSDHAGLAHFFQEKGSTIYVSKVDGDMINNSMNKYDTVWINAIKNAKLQGLQEDNLDLENHPGFKYRPKEFINYKVAVFGEHIQIDDYDFEIIDLSGHTPGITGLYEKNHKILFCGDHILGKITPNITFWGFEYGDSLGDYFKNLDKVYDMDITHLFSSHRFLIKDHRQRIDELKKHHQKRLDEIMQIIEKNGKSTVCNIAKNMHWDIKAKNWEDFPKSQKWFATGEAHSHLEHLRYTGKLKMEKIQDVLYYYI